MASIKELLGTNIQLYDSIISKVGFNIRCCIPGIIQKYDPKTNTAEIQPAVREEVVGEDNSVSYVNLPLLVNVPILFPSCSVGSIKFILQQGDECLVLFSDLSYDNFWKSGNIQNPVEVRRHDLSDSLAFPCIISQKNTKNFTGNGMTITAGQVAIEIENGEITFSSAEGTITLTQMIGLLRHTHEAPAMGGETTGPHY